MALQHNRHLIVVHDAVRESIEQNALRNLTCIPYLQINPPSFISHNFMAESAGTYKTVEIAMRPPLSGTD